jgi:hypothetical protein
MCTSQMLPLPCAFSWNIFYHPVVALGFRINCALEDTKVPAWIFSFQTLICFNVWVLTNSDAEVLYMRKTVAFMFYVTRIPCFLCTSIR